MYNNKLNSIIILFVSLAVYISPVYPLSINPTGNFSPVIPAGGFSTPDINSNGFYISPQFSPPEETKQPEDTQINPEFQSLLDVWSGI